MSPQAEMIYMSAILQTYDKILNQMLKELPTPGPTTAQSSGDKGTAELRSQLNYILKKITNLRIQHYNKPEQLLKMLQPLREVQVRTYFTEMLMDVRQWEERGGQKCPRGRSTLLGRKIDGESDGDTQGTRVRRQRGTEQGRTEGEGRETRTEKRSVYVRLGFLWLFSHLFLYKSDFPPRITSSFILSS